MYIPPEQAAAKRRADAMELVRTDPVLREEVRELLEQATDPAAARVAEVNAANTGALRASLQLLKRHSHTTIGRIAYTTVLAAAAGAGEHSCEDPSKCHPGKRCRPVEPGGISWARRADSLGIRRETFDEARVRMHNTDHDVTPQQAVGEGCYIHSERKTRSDVTHPEVTACMKVYWHSDDVSRATGNSGKLICFRQVGVQLIWTRCCFCTNQKL